MSTATIPLTQGKVAIVDQQDYDRVSQFKWFAYDEAATRFLGPTTETNFRRAS